MVVELVRVHHPLSSDWPCLKQLDGEWNEEVVTKKWEKSKEHMKIDRSDRGKKTPCGSIFGEVIDLIYQA